MRRVRGCLREVVAYESRTAEGLLQEELQSHPLFLERIYFIAFLGYNNI